MQQQLYQQLQLLRLATQPVRRLLGLYRVKRLIRFGDQIVVHGHVSEQNGRYDFLADLRPCLRIHVAEHVGLLFLHDLEGLGGVLVLEHALVVVGDGQVVVGGDQERVVDAEVADVVRGGREAQRGTLHVAEIVLDFGRVD